MSPPKCAMLPLLALVSQTSAWGTLGHNTVAYIAQDFVSTKTAQFAQDILGDTSANYLANVATWADSYRSTAEGKFSAPLHYIDALDSPPTSCNVDYERDCPEEGCIVSAIANYTTRVQQTSLSATEKQKALKWIVHFVGDIHQPLHVENLEVGGNSIDVTFEGDDTNLHHIWDSNMPEKLIGGYALSDARTWATELTTAIKSGKYATASKTWLNGTDKSDSIATGVHWATDANSYVCSTVIPEGADAVRNKELDGAYYNSSIPVIQEQIAKAGYRLAAWLDLIATGETEVAVRREAVVRRDVKLEDWMVEARRARRAFGWDCGHKH